jgi:hypothetical protein
MLHELASAADAPDQPGGGPETASAFVITAEPWIGCRPARGRCWRAGGWRAQSAPPQNYSSPRRTLGRRVPAVPRRQVVLRADRYRAAAPGPGDGRAPGREPRRTAKDGRGRSLSLLAATLRTAPEECCHLTSHPRLHTDARFWHRIVGVSRESAHAESAPPHGRRRQRRRMFRGVPSMPEGARLGSADRNRNTDAGSDHRRIARGEPPRRSPQLRGGGQHLEADLRFADRTFFVVQRR